MRATKPLKNDFKWFFCNVNGKFDEKAIIIPMLGFAYQWYTFRMP